MLFCQSGSRSLLPPFIFLTRDKPISPYQTGCVKMQQKILLSHHFLLCPKHQSTLLSWWHNKIISVGTRRHFCLFITEIRELDDSLFCVMKPFFLLSFMKPVMCFSPRYERQNLTERIPESKDTLKVKTTGSYCCEDEINCEENPGNVSFKASPKWQVVYLQCSVH